MDNLKIGIDGFNHGPFPKPEDLAARLSQWIFLSGVEAMGFTQEDLVAVLADWLKLFGGSLEGSMQKLGQLFVSQFLDAARKMAKLVPKSETVQEIAANGSVKRRHRKSKEERIAEVVALFSALFAYLSCVEREGPDRANAYSMLVHETLSMELPAYVLRVPELLTTLEKESPSAFLKRLKKYPSSASVILGGFEGGRPKGLKGLMERPRECLECPFLVAAKSKGKGWIKECSECASRPRLPWGWNKAIVAGRIPKLGEGDVPDLHDPGCYLEALLVSLLVGREDFVTKGINLSVAQEEGLQVMDGKYAELGGQQWIAESLAQGHLDKRSQGIIKASFPNGEAFHRAEAALNTLEPMMSEFKPESTEELEESERLRRLGQPISLDTEIEGEEGEMTTLADMIHAPADPGEAMSQLLEIFEKELQPEDVELFKERFIDGKSITEIAIERGWNYDRVQKRAYRLEKQIEEILTKMSD